MDKNSLKMAFLRQKRSGECAIKLTPGAYNRRPKVRAK
jgi:hypothetical protein